MDSLDADVAEINQQEANRNTEPAVEEPTAEPAVEPENWENRYNQLEQKTSHREKEMRTWLGQHFDSEEKYAAFQEWSKTYGSTQTPAPTLEDEEIGEEEDIFTRVDTHAQKVANMEKQLSEIASAREAQEIKRHVNEIEQEATALAEQYPVVATKEGREAMMRLAYADGQQGGDSNLETAAKMLQSLHGTASPQTAAPQTRPQPTVMRGGGLGKSAVVSDSDPREKEWYSKDSIDSMDIFERIGMDTGKEFGISR